MRGPLIDSEDKKNAGSQLNVLTHSPNASSLWTPVQRSVLRQLLHWHERPTKRPLDSLAAAEDHYSHVIAEFPTIPMPSFIYMIVLHRIQHHIPTNSAPIYSKARQLPHDKLTAAKTEFRIIVSSNGPTGYGRPMVDHL